MVLQKRGGKYKEYLQLVFENFLSKKRELIYHRASAILFFS